MGIKSEVIIIGADHHNTLAAVRDIGKNYSGQATVLIHSNRNEKLMISSSKYVRGRLYSVTEKADSIFSWLIDNHMSFMNGTVLFPCSDLAAFAIDRHALELSKYYRIAGFSEMPGYVSTLMDKWEQKQFADKYDIPMAKTWRLDLNDDINNSEITFPCILKPEISAFGRKSDIIVCDDTEAFQEALILLKNKQYSIVLCQEFLNKKYESCCYGCIVNDKFVGTTVRKIRETPKGSTCYAVFDSKGTESIVDRIIKVLTDLKYSGPIDLELLVCNDKAYLCEINFRQSGNAYALNCNGVPTATLWCNSTTSKEIESINAQSMHFNGKTHMDDKGDLLYLSYNKISIANYLMCFIRASGHAIWDLKDLSGTFAFYKPLFMRAVNKILKKRK